MSQGNDFKAFSISENANIVSQGKYEESQNLKMGFTPENVSTHVLNKVLRQSSTISSVVANFIATQSGEDVLDDGRGVDSGRGILTHQGDAIRNITGSVSGRTVSTSSRMFSYAGGAFYTSVTNPGSHFNAGATYNSVAQDRFSLLEIDASRIVPTANENRPRNIAFNYTRHLSSCLFVGCTHSPRSHSYLCSRGFAPLPPRCILKSIRYIS
nr:hypothetical protein [Photorhabdus bodei]